MKSILPIQLGAPLQSRVQKKQSAKAQLAAAGPGSRPSAPRSLIAQAGSRKVLLTWDGPQRMDNVTGWRIYKDTESNLIQEISDPTTFQTMVDLTAGAVPPIVTLFVSAVNPNSEGPKVMIQAKPSVEAGAPPDPAPPEGWNPHKSLRENPQP